MELSVSTSDHVRIAIRHTQTGHPNVVIVAPGFFQSKDTRTFRRIEQNLKDSFDVISMDFRGHGKSGGLYTFSAKEKEDVKAVVDYAKKSYPKVGLLGFSYAGTIAVIEQAAYHNLTSLACVASPMASDQIELRWWTPEAVRLAWRGMEKGAGVRPGNPFLKKVKAVDVVGRLDKTPILFIHGTKDPTVGGRHSRALYEAAREPKALKIIRGGSHAQDMFRTHTQEFMTLVVDWFEKTLR